MRSLQESILLDVSLRQSRHESRTFCDQFDWDYDHFIDWLRITRLRRELEIIYHPPRFGGESESYYFIVNKLSFPFLMMINLIHNYRQTEYLITDLY